MPHCFVSTCNNYYGRTRGNAKIKYHMLPTSALTEKWIELCGYEKGTQAPSYARVCSVHFSPDCYQRDLQHELLGLPLRKKLRKDAVPDIHLPVGTQPLSSSKFETIEILKDSKRNNKSIECSGESDDKKNNEIPALMNIENQNELSSQISITNNLDEAFKQFQAFLDSGNVKVTKIEKTSTPNVKKKLTDDKTKNKTTTCMKNKKPQVRIRLKNNNSAKKIKNTDKKMKMLDKTTLKKKQRVSLDENLLREILNATKTKNVVKERRKSDQNIQNKKNNTKRKLMEKNERKIENNVEIIEVNSANENVEILQKNRLNKLPMRSSFRIAKKKSIESLSDSFTHKINHNGDKCNKRVNFADKLKFMAKLQLKYEKSETRPTERAHHFVLPTYDSKFSLEDEGSSLHKMRIMEDVREGCMIQPSSPGHAELRPESEPMDVSEQKQNEHQETSRNEGDESTIQNSVKEETIDCTNTAEEKTENEANTSKRKEEDEEPSTAKKLRAEIDENFRHRDKILNEFMDIIGCENASADQLQIHTEQLLSEIKTLNDLAREKEMEWNNIIHIKKIKEELLIRIERKRQISVMNGDKPESDGDFEERPRIGGQSLLRYNLSRLPKSDKYRNRHILPKPHTEFNGSFDPRQGIRNRPTLDVQSIIADYRQRHPEAVPRRGRRIRSAHNGANGNSNILNFSSIALGSGAQVKHNFQDMGNELNILLSAMEANQGEGSRLGAEPHQNLQDSASFKDILVQFAKLSQNDRNELLQNLMKPPPPYPEVTVHPVTSASTPSSLLHGILTKSPSKVNNKTAFSPTLAKLLTAPERAGNHLTSSPSIINSLSHPSNMSISEILSTSKARNEITITPVDTQFEPPMKNQKAANLEDDETEDSADRLVIDESNEDLRRGDNNSDAGDEVPQCQGCNQKTAQFVCAGCGNQWYCSRDCQVAAWDEHSEVCSG